MSQTNKESTSATMKRNINITNQFVKDSIPNTTPVDVSNINSLVNYSVDSIICGMLEYVDDKEFEAFITSLLEKIRNEGNIIIKFVNLKKLFIEYINQQIPSSEVFKYLTNKKNILCPDRIINILNQNSFMILKMDQNENYFTIMAQRTPKR
jgi:cyclopropane fatty-acyl-phospholipid synthase-like methyltransferase